MTPERKTRPCHRLPCQTTRSRARRTTGMPSTPASSPRSSGAALAPFAAVRVVAVAGDPSDSHTFYFGSTGGGVWKTTDGGALSGRTSPTASSSAPRSAPSPSRQSDPNVIYVGMGEADHSRQRLAWRRRLQVDRRRQDLDATRVSQTRATSARCASTRPTPTSSTSRRSATRTARTRSAASTAPRTAARPGSRSSSAARTPARSTSSHGPAQPARPLRRLLGGAALRPTQLRAAARAAASSSPPTAATPGPRSPATRGCRQGSLGKIGIAARPPSADRV